MMILSLCLLLPALSPSSQEICSAPGALPAPTLYLSQTSARPGDSVWLKCSVFSQLLATRVIFCKDGEEVSSQRGSEEKATYDYVHVVSGGSSGNYTCVYEIKDSDNRVTRSQLSPDQRLSLTGDDSSSGDVGGSPPQGLDLNLLLGITIPAILVLAVALYLLGKKGGYESEAKQC
ncbi:butyrophilin-like protein 9-like [Platysternon megacephalum]|uniref:Butyrophilin-like protein 9-like n=1 Tax=Platysternon megacephalum TaxID=55544 RepID=A0A4D9DSI4_9SAUR|nr:butyrophilin-like protein 9-like [Platysternon megacephalum]